MFCRFGSLELSRPVAATTWLNEACTRPVSGMDHLRQGVDVGALELGVLPVLDDLGRQRMQPGQLLQHVGVGAAGRSWSCLTHRQLQLVEQDLLKLLGRGDVELAARPARRSPAPARSIRSPYLAAQLGQPVDVDLDAVVLQLDQHVDQRHFQLVRTASRASLSSSRSARIGRSRQATHGVLARIVGHLARRGTSSIRFWFLPVPISSAILIVSWPQVALRPARRGCGSARRRRAGSWPPSCRTPRRPARTPAARSTIMSYFRFWPIFSIAGILQDRPQGFERRGRVELRLARRRPHRHVLRLVVLPGERIADDLGPARPDAGRLGVEREPRLCRQLLHQPGRGARACRSLRSAVANRSRATPPAARRTFP